MFAAKRLHSASSPLLIRARAGGRPIPLAASQRSDQARITPRATSSRCDRNVTISGSLCSFARKIVVFAPPHVHGKMRIWSLSGVYTAQLCGEIIRYYIKETLEL